MSVVVRKALLVAVFTGLASVLLGLTVQQQGVQDEIAWHEDLISGLADQDWVSAEAESQVIDLPETGPAWYLSVFVDPNWEDIARDREVVGWFSSEPRLARLRGQTHDRLYTTEDDLYKIRFAKTIPQVPAVMLQDPSGKVRYKAGGEVPLPKTGAALADKLQALFSRFPCPRPKPKPDPEPKPDVTPDLPVVPDMDVDVPGPLPMRGPSASLVAMVGLMLFVIGGVASLLYNVHQNQ